MQKLKATLRRHYSKGYDSDSTGYSSSSSDRPISRSQFILARPQTALTSYSPYPCNYGDYPSTSYSSGLGSQEEETFEPDEEEEEESTIRARSAMTVIECGRSSACRSSPFPFDDGAEDDLEDLFDQLELNEDPPPLPPEMDGTSTLTRKRLLIKDPDESSKIYFSERLLKKRSLPKKGSIPRSILKKEPSLVHSHIYEEIEDDHLDPLPEDVRPELPERPRVRPIRIFPPCKAFQPRRLELPRYPSTKRRKKLPSLHKISQ